MIDRAPRRLSLLATFGVASFVVTALLGFVLAAVLHSMVRARAVANAEGTASVVTLLGVQPLLQPVDLREGLDARRFAVVDRALREAAEHDEIHRIKIYGAGGEVIYSDDWDAIGEREASPRLAAALAGRVSAELADPHGHGTLAEPLLEVYVPIAYEGRAAVGAAELYLPYSPIAEAARSDELRLQALLVVGLAALWLTLFRLVAHASRTLEQQTAANIHQALHDGLTGLANRALFSERLEHGIALARRRGTGLAVVLLDVDHFQEINDTLGHASGDRVLVHVGRTLREAVRDSDVVARFGGDEYAILLTDVADDAVPEIVDGLLDALGQPLSVDGVALDVRARAGYARFPEDCADTDEFVRRADGALHAAKRLRSRCERYDPERDEYSPERLALAAELRSAIDDGQLVCHYQPVVDLTTGRITSAEALVRWDHPRLGLLAPGSFLPLAEPTDLIGPLTEHVLDTALRQCREWRDAGLDLVVAVNLSARNLVDVDLPGTVDRLLETHGVPPTSLCLEITESVLMSDPERARAVVGRLVAVGVQVAIDDFGTGYSSLAYLQQLPVSELKIDRSFVAALAERPDDAAIVRFALDLARELGLGTVAEGIEDRHVLTELQRLGCDAAQGFYLSRPLPADQLLGWVRDSLPTARDGSLSSA